MSNTKLISTVGLAFCLCTFPVQAHHSFSAQFDAKKPLKMTGTVTSVEWQNPHSWFYMDVKDAAGTVTAASPAVSRSATTVRWTARRRSVASEVMRSSLTASGSLHRTWRTDGARQSSRRDGGAPAQRRGRRTPTFFLSSAK